MIHLANNICLGGSGDPHNVKYILYFQCFLYQVLCFIDGVTFVRKFELIHLFAYRRNSTDIKDHMVSQRHAGLMGTRKLYFALFITHLELLLLPFVIGTWRSAHRRKTLFTSGPCRNYNRKVVVANAPFRLICFDSGRLALIY